MKDAHLLVTGGAGSVGRAFVAHLLASDDAPARITVFSRDERKQHEMAVALNGPPDRLRFVIGDVRDASRVDEVMAGVDLVLHAAAMKHVPAAEANPLECVRTNVEGARNVIVAARAHGVRRVVGVSSDKAVSPSTVYGASKLQMERLFQLADAGSDTRFTLVRYANVFGSSGSVVPVFLDRRASGVLPLTDPAMTRFSITMRDGLALLRHAFAHGLGGEVFVPVCPSYRLDVLARAIAPEAELRVLGARPGEKLHESMFSLLESRSVVRSGRYYALLPAPWRDAVDAYAARTGAVPLPAAFEYDSGSNDQWLSEADIRRLVATELP